MKMHASAQSTQQRPNRPHIGKTAQSTVPLLALNHVKIHSGRYGAEHLDPRDCHVDSVAAFGEASEVVVNNPSRAVRQVIRDHVGRVDDKDVQLLFHGYRPLYAKSTTVRLSSTAKFTDELAEASGCTAGAPEGPNLSTRRTLYFEGTDSEML